jgi:hypothetical protein
MHLRFVEEHVQNVPDQTGIFFLYDERFVVYVGRSVPRSSLKAELLHALAVAMADDMAVTHFSYEVTHTPKTRATEALRRHFEQWGRLPRYNASSSRREAPRERQAELRR